MADISFKERVAQAAIKNALLYKQVFVDYEYLICSDAFVNEPYYILASQEDNYRHLIGVNTKMSASDFFSACVDGTLCENDFDFKKPNRSEKEIKGSVRKKIQVLPQLVSMMGNELVAQEDFSKNGVTCAFATTDCNFTVGFVHFSKSRPMTLLKGDEIDWNKAAYVDLILRRPSGVQKFDTIIYGNENAIAKYYSKLNSIIEDNLQKESQL